MVGFASMEILGSLRKLELMMGRRMAEVTVNLDLFLAKKPTQVHISIV